LSARTGDAKGRRAEQLAALFLSLKGYRVVLRRVRTGAGEVDLVALKGDVLAFVEVKHRADVAAGASSVRVRQQRRILAAANAVLARHPEWTGKTIRFDVVLMAPGKWPRHILNAWTGSDHNAG
jgi:putative endonuclease